MIFTAEQQYTPEEKKELHEISDKFFAKADAKRDELNIIIAKCVRATKEHTEFTAKEQETFLAKETKANKVNEMIAEMNSLYLNREKQIRKWEEEKEQERFNSFNGDADKIYNNALFQIEQTPKHEFESWKQWTNKYPEEILNTKDGEELEYFPEIVITKTAQKGKDTTAGFLVSEKYISRAIDNNLRLHLQFFKSDKKKLKAINTYKLKQIAASPYVIPSVFDVKIPSNSLPPVNILNSMPFESTYELVRFGIGNAPYLKFIETSFSQKQSDGSSNSIEKNGIIYTMGKSGTVLSINSLKLLKVAMYGYMKTHPAKIIPTSYDVEIDLKAYMELTGYKGSTKEFRKAIKKLLDELANSGTYSWEKGSGYKIGKDSNSITGERDYMKDHIIYKHGIRNGNIFLRFSEDLCRFMVKAPCLPLPRKELFMIPAKKPNEYRIAMAMHNHYWMDQSRKAGNYNLLRVETLLKETDLPSLEEVQKTQHSWKDRIRDPFERAISYLKESNNIKNYYYCHPGSHGKKMTDAEEDIIRNGSYSDWIKTVIFYEMDEPEDYKATTEARLENKQKLIRKKAIAKATAIKKNSKKASKA